MPGRKADVIAADGGQLRLLDEAGLAYEVEIADLGEHYTASRRADAAYAEQVGLSSLPSGRTGYRQYADYQAELKKLATDKPSIVKPVVLPNKSLQGRELQGVEIAEEADHAVLTGTATPGNVLRVRKTFVTKTGPQCTYAQGYLNSTGIPAQASAVNGVAPGPVVDIPDFLDTTTVVPASGTFSWHVGPSTRPFVGARYDNATGEAVPTGQTEAWTLTCETPAGQVLRTQSLVTARGDRLALGALC